MNAEFSFLEYTYNPKQCPETPESLRRLGFSCRADNNNSTSVWKQNYSIIFLRSNTDFNGARVTGLGFITPKNVISDLGAKKDPGLNFHVTEDPGGLRIILVDEKEETNLYKLGFVKKDSIIRPDIGISYISGITYNYFDNEKINFYSRLGFRITKSGQQYSQLTTSDNRFTIISNRDEQNKRVQNVICETTDIFSTTAKGVVNKIQFKDFNLPDNLDYGSITHKIYGYNCLPFGNQNGYTIENFIPNALPNTDMILKMRKKKFDIMECSLFEYYGNPTTSNE